MAQYESTAKISANPTAFIKRSGNKDADVLAAVLTKLSRMASLKSHRVPLVRQYEFEYRDSHIRQRHPGKADYKCSDGFVLVMQKLSDFMASLPKYDFQPLDEKASEKVNATKRAWDYWLRISGFERELTKVALDAFVKGSGYALEQIRKTERVIQRPTGKFAEDGSMEYEEVTVCDEERPYLEHIPWDSAFINSNDFLTATEAIVVRHWMRDEFMSRRAKMMEASGVDPESIPFGKRYDWVQSQNGGYSFGEQGEPSEFYATWPRNTNRDQYVSEIHFYSKYLDQYVIIANDTWINKKKGGAVEPLQSLHKELPLLVLNDYYIEGDYTGRGEYDVTLEARRLKDAARSLAIDVTKASIGAFFISPDADFDGGSVKFGTDEINVADPEAVKHFSPSINIQYPQSAEKYADSDITRISGVDNLTLDPSETASKTVAKVNTQKSRVSLMLKQAAWTFFEKFARLRMGNIILLHKAGTRTISVYGESVSKDGTATKLNGGYGIFTVSPELVSDKVNVIPNIESMAVDSAQDRQDIMTLAQVVGGMIDSDTGKPIVNPKFWLESLRPYYPNVNFDLAVGEGVAAKTPDQIMAEAGLLPSQSDGQSVPAPETNPNYIPPAQRSGAKKSVATPGSAPKLAME